MENRNNPTWEERKNQNPQNDSNSRGSKEETGNELKPDNRLKDGTNDFENGDQEPTSEKSTGVGSQEPGE